MAADRYGVDIDLRVDLAKVGKNDVPRLDDVGSSVEGQGHLPGYICVESQFIIERTINAEYPRAAVLHREETAVAPAILRKSTTVHFLHPLLVLEYVFMLATAPEAGP